MDSWEVSLRRSRTRPTTNCPSSNPSFSSTLLDAIYRSIDEGEDRGEDELVMYKETVQKKQSRTTTTATQYAAIRDNKTDVRKAVDEDRQTSYRADKLTENNFVSIRRSSDYDDFKRRPKPGVVHSTSSSSESSYGGFSSSEAESIRSTTLQRPKPIRTSAAPARADQNPQGKYQQTFLKSFSHHQEHDDVSYANVKSKNRASPKKTKKQPVSPGARLAGFLNSLFTAAGTAKMAKLSSSFNGDDRRSVAQASSTCSSASSYSRSCLSKTPSSRGNSVNGIKRSVRFYPVSVIVDEDSRPCGQKSLYEEDRTLKVGRKIGGGEPLPRYLSEELKLHIMEKNKLVEEAANRILNRYQSKTEMLMRREVLAVQKVRMEEEEEDDDDAASDASSDLFELENLGAIGVRRYREELPVYETTHPGTNRAIANGLIL